MTENRLTSPWYRVVLTISLGITSVSANAQDNDPIPPPNIPLPVEITNPPDLPVPTIESDRAPIPWEFFEFQRQYCTTWEPREVIRTRKGRSLVQYKAQLPRIYFDQEVFFSGEVYGYIYTNGGAEGNRGRTDVISTCAGNPPAGAWDARTVNGRGRTNQIIYEDEVSGFACDFSDTNPVVNLYVFVQVLERGGSTEVIGEPGAGEVCFRIESISPRPSNTE